MKALIAALAVAVCSADALADSWFFPPERTVKEYQFGEVKIELVTDARENTRWPLFELMIYKGDELQAKYRNIGFDKIFASEDNRYFLGVSNTGIPGTAFVIFDSDGKLLREVKHRFLDLDLESRSPTLHKQWYDDSDPGVEFVVERGWLTELHINTTNVRYNQIEVTRIDLMDSMWRRTMELRLLTRTFGKHVQQLKAAEKTPVPASEKGTQGTEDADSPVPQVDRND